MKRKQKKVSASGLRRQRGKSAANGRKKGNKKRDSKILVPGGSVMYNLCCSNHWHGAYPLGSMNNVVGDSSSGKSFLVLTGLAQTAVMPIFDDYDLIYDDAEEANEFDMEGLFGPKLVQRLKRPDVNDTLAWADQKKPPVHSATIEQFGDFLFERIENGKPFVYILDSFDSIDSKDEMQKDEENRAKRKKGEKEKGSFNAVKQKKASKLFRQIIPGLKKTNSCLIIVSQTRDNLNAASFATKYRAGGKALKFYSRIEAWLTHIKKITKTVKGVHYKIGSDTRVKLGKNKVSGNYRDVDFPIYRYYGIDDIRACMDFLIKNGVISKPKGKSKISNSPFGLTGSYESVIKAIEQKVMQEELYKATEQCWMNIEDVLKNTGRKPKFG